MNSKLNHTTFKDIPIYEVPSMDVLIQYAFQNKQSLLPINEKTLREYNLQNEALFKNSVTYPQDLAALFCLRKEKLTNSVVVDPCTLFNQIIHTYNASSRFYLIGDNKMVLASCCAVLQQRYTGIELHSLVVGPNLIQDLKSISKEWNQNNPDFIFIANSKMYPQLFDMFLLLMRHKHNAIYVNVADAFDRLFFLTRKSTPYTKNKIALSSFSNRIIHSLYLIRFKLLIHLNII